MAYYIASLTHTKKEDDYLTLWRANNSGYCWSKENAGVYEEITPGYHDNDGNMPIEVEKLDRVFALLPYVVSSGVWLHMVPLTKEVLKYLGLKWNDDELVRKKVV